MLGYILIVDINNLSLEPPVRFLLLFEMNVKITLQGRFSSVGASLLKGKNASTISYGRNVPPMSNNKFTKLLPESQLSKKLTEC